MNFRMDSPPATIDRPLKIAIVHASDAGGGAERSTLTLHQSLRQMGHDCRMFVGAKETNEEGVIPIPRSRTFPGVMRIARWLEDDWGVQNLYTPWFRNLHRAIGEVDVVHIHSIWGGRYPFADLTGIKKLAARYPTIMTLRDGWMLTGHCACPIGCNRWQQGCGRCPDLQRMPAVTYDSTAYNWQRKRRLVQSAPLRITTVSAWLRGEVAQSPIFAGKQVDVVYNSIDETTFTVGSQAQARQELGLPRDRFIVLLAGQSIEGVKSGIAQQGVLALNSLNRPNILPLLIGHSAGLVQQTLIGPSTTLPFQSDAHGMARVYRAANLTLVPSEYETFGRVAAESLMCGTPVVAYATGGLSEIVQPGVNGCLVPFGDVPGFAEVIERLEQDPAEYAKLQAGAAPSALSRFTRAKIANDYVELYQQMVSPISPPC